jgi:hypothetical protein
MTELAYFLAHGSACLGSMPLLCMANMLKPVNFHLGCDMVYELCIGKNRAEFVTRAVNRSRRRAIERSIGRIEAVEWGILANISRPR